MVLYHILSMLDLDGNREKNVNTIDTWQQGNKRWIVHRQDRKRRMVFPKQAKALLLRLFHGSRLFEIKAVEKLVHPAFILLKKLRRGKAHDKKNIVPLEHDEILALKRALLNRTTKNNFIGTRAIL